MSLLRTIWKAHSAFLKKGVMPPVSIASILDNENYEQQRAIIRQRVLKVKQARRIHLGDDLTFLFENPETVRYQVQEMLRVESISDPNQIQQELFTYNRLLGGPGELGCTLMIEIIDEAERREKLTQWTDLLSYLYVLLPDQSRVYAFFDDCEIVQGQLAAVQFVKFNTEGISPIAVGSDHSTLMLETWLTPQQQAAFASDLNMASQPTHPSASYPFPKAGYGLKPYGL